MAVASIGKKVTRGAKEAFSTEALAATGGILGEFYLEKFAIKSLPKIFGVNDGSAPLPQQQKFARVGLRAGIAVLGGVMATGALKLGDDKLTRSAGIGITAIALKHILDGFMPLTS